MRQKLIDIQPDIKNIKFTFEKTFGSTNGYKTGWEELTNCKVLQRTFMLYNGGICYDFTPASYHFFLYLSAGSRSNSSN